MLLRALRILGEYRIVAGIALLALALRLVNLTDFHVLESDEAVYAQSAAHLIAGNVPYRDFFYPSPPVYLFLEAAVVVVDQSILSIRLLAVAFGVLNVFLTWRLARDLTGAGWRAHLAALTYAFLPFAVYFDKIALIEGPLTAFVIAAFILFFRARERALTAASPPRWFDRKYFVAGLVLGVAILTKYSAGLIGGLMALSFIFARDRKNAPSFVLGAAVVPAFAVLGLAASGTFGDFWTETVSWQMIRFPQTTFEKTWGLFNYFGWVYPLLAPIVGILLISRFRSRSRILPWYLASVGLLLVGKTTFVHYFVMLTPLLCVAFAEVMPPLDVWRRLWGRLRRFRIRQDLPVVARQAASLAVVAFLLVNYAFLVVIAYGGPWPGSLSAFGEPTEVSRILVKDQVARYIGQVTLPNETIWTSDPALAYLARRQIVPANVSSWRFQGFFSDVWAYNLDGGYRGPIPGYPDGLITLEELRQGWEQQLPRVIVIIRTSLVDRLVWDGFSNPDTNQTGLGSWIESRYDLGPVVAGIGSTFSPGNIEVWVRS